MSQRKLILLAFATLVIMGGLGYYLTPITREIQLYTFLEGEFPIGTQLTMGSLAGLLIALLGWQIIRTPYLTSVCNFFSRIVGDIRLSIIQIIFVSFCAGVGEEFLFRGAIQPLFGIWVTSFIFVFIHGYLNPFNRPLFVYGVFMTLSIALIGYLTERVGIISSMSAHMMVDVVLLYQLTYSKTN